MALLEIGFRLGWIDSAINKLDTNYAKEVYKKSFLLEFGEDKVNDFEKEADLLIQTAISIRDSKDYLLQFESLTKWSQVALEMFFNIGKGVKDLSYSETNDNSSFISKGLKMSEIEYGVYSFIKFKRNIKMFLFWPMANKFMDRRERALNYLESKCDIVYKKDLRLSWNQLYQLMIFAYEGIKWMDTPNESYYAVCAKCFPCFSVFKPLSVFFVDNCDVEKAREIKCVIRDIFEIGSHSCHSSDNDTETMRFVHLFLNNNSLDVLKKVNLSASKSTTDTIINYRNSNSINDNYCLELSSINSLFGYDNKDNSNRDLSVSLNPFSFNKVFYIFDVPFYCEKRFIKSRHKPYFKNLFKFLIAKINNKIFRRKSPTNNFS